jgi:TatD DNase family protein
LPERFSSNGKVIDIGANLTHKSFDHDRDAVIQRSLDAGVEKIIVTSSSFQDTKKAIELTDLYPNVLWPPPGLNHTTPKRHKKQQKACGNN